MKHFLILLSVLFIGGCSAHTHKPSTSKNEVVKSFSSRCKIVGKKKGKYTTVLVRRGCLRKGRTTIVVWFHAIKPGVDKRTAVRLVKLGVEEATKEFISILGYTPKLALLPVPVVRGYFSYTFIVVE